MACFSLIEIHMHAFCRRKQTPLLKLHITNFIKYTLFRNFAYFVKTGKYSLLRKTKSLKLSEFSQENWRKPSGSIHCGYVVP